MAYVESFWAKGKEIILSMNDNGYTQVVFEGKVYSARRGLQRARKDADELAKKIINNEMLKENL